MKVTNEPALGMVWENSDMVFPVARIATPATRNAHGAWAPMAATTSVIDRKMPSTGARLASVEDSVSNRESAPLASRGRASVPRGSSMVAIRCLLFAAGCLLPAVWLPVWGEYRAGEPRRATVGHTNQCLVLVVRHNLGWGSCPATA